MSAVSNRPALGVVRARIEIDRMKCWITDPLIAKLMFSRMSPVTLAIFFPIHQVDPAVDREREALRADFSRASCVARLVEKPVTEPMRGQNTVGSPFFTDGLALVVFLKCGLTISVRNVCRCSDRCRPIDLRS
jgi:hypothetical protein